MEMLDLIICCKNYFKFIMNSFDLISCKVTIYMSESTCMSMIRTNKAEYIGI